MSSCGWSRVGGTGVIQSQIWNCVGNLSNRQCTEGSILADFPEDVTTCGQAMNLIGQELQKRLHAKNMYVSGSSTSSFTITLQLTNDMANTGVISLITSSSCRYPINCTWQRQQRNSSGSQQFYEVMDLINYLVANLKT